MKFLDSESIWVLADAGPGRPGRPGAARPDSGPAWGLGLSLLMHLLAAAAIVGYGQLRGYGEGAAGGPPGPLVMTVNILDWPGLGEQDGGGLAEAQEADETIEEAAEKQEVQEVTESEVEADAINIEPEPKIKIPEPMVEKKTKNLAPDPDREGPRKTRAGPAGPVGKTGPAGSAGSGAGSFSSGGGGGGGGDSAGYLKGNYEYIKKRIRQHLVYSPQAKRLGIQGTVTVAFVIGADGQAREATVSQTSGHPALDESALKAVQNASPFPPPPETARIVIPISFSLK